MNTRRLPWILIAIAVLMPAAAGQGPLLHYSFSEGGSPTTTENTGTLSPGPSPLVGHTLTGTSQNRTNCLTGVTGASNEVTTPYTVSGGNNSWTIGFALNSTASPGFQYLFSEDTASGWRCFTDGAAGTGNIRMTGGTVPNVDIVGGAGESGWVRVAWVHDTVANQIRAYLNGVLVTTIATTTVNFTSGNTLIIGRLGATSLLTGNRVEEFRLYDYALTAAEVSSWANNAGTGITFSKLMITEVSWGDPDGLEITNFGTSSLNLTNWTVRWRDATGTNISSPLNVVIAQNESIVVMESLPVPEGVPAGTQAIDRFVTPIGTTSGAITVGLFDSIANPMDEVRISDTAGTHPGWSFGSAFRGLAMRGAVSATTGQVGTERIWGLDSDGGTDWTEQPNRSLGRENRSSGPRGTDPTPVIGIKINEIDDSPDCIELYNPTGASVSLGGWFFLMSGSQNSPHTLLSILSGTVIGPSGYAVFGTNLMPPPELPGGIPYVTIGALPFVSFELDCALYDDLGRLVDLVRAPRVGSTLIHNHPRAPSYWSDFVGAAGRNANGGDNAFGRNVASADTNDGGDWFPVFTRTMGSANVSTSLAGPGGHDDVFDVRLNETGIGQGFQAIMNAGSGAAGDTFNFLVSIGHSLGTGPFFGLGGDALANIPVFYNVPPFSGVLDAQGSGRIDLDPGSIPPGIDADFIFVRQLPSGAVAAVTYVLAYDT